MNEPANITPRQAAGDVGVHPRTIQRWCRNRWVAHHRTPGGHIRFTATQVAALRELASREQHHPEVLTPNPRAPLELVTQIERAPSRRAGAA